MPGANYEILWFGLLQHFPHGNDVLRCPSPITLNSQIPDHKFFLGASGNPQSGSDNFLGHKPRRTQRRFMIKENAATGEDPIGFAIVGDGIMRRSLGHGIRAARMKRGCFRGWGWGVSKTLA